GRRSFRIWSKWPAAANEEDLWLEYQTRGRALAQSLRVVVSVVTFMVVGLLLMGIFGYSRVPARGFVAYLAERGTLVASVVAVLVLNYLVVDTTWLCERFVVLVGQLQTSPTTNGGGKRDLLRLRLIEKRTSVVGRFVYYPLALLTLLLLSRSRFFDDWSLPIGLAAIFGVLGLYVVSCAVTLSLAAQRARRRAL